jgi:protein phosphatase
METIGLGLSNTGAERERNEDTMVVDDDLGLYLVCDGIGGRLKGHVAAEKATATVIEYLTAKSKEIDAARDGDKSADDIAEMAEAAVLEACREVHLLGQAEVHGSMGCTMTLVIPIDEKAVMAHVGNTRLYLYRRDAVHQLSMDHTMANELVQAGVISAEEADGHAYSRVLTRSLGSQESVLVDTLVFDFLPADRLLLCTNGLGSYITDPTPLIEYMGEDFDAIPGGLIGLAQEKGGSDDITVVAVRTDEDDGRPTLPPGEGLDVMAYFDRMAAVPLFADIGLVQLQRLLNISEELTLKEGDTVLEEGDTCPGLHVVLDGSLELSRGGETLGTLAAGDQAGAATLYTERPCRATLKAIAQSLVLVIDRDRFHELTQRLPRLGVILLDRLGQKTVSDLDEARERLKESAPNLEAVKVAVGDLL